MELPYLGWWSVYAVVVRAAGAFRLADFLGQPIVSGHQQNLGGKKNGPISGATFQRGKFGR
jgi:hypothetical protein